MMIWWQLILDEIVLAVVLTTVIVFYKRWSVRTIIREVKGYLAVTLSEHRQKAAQMVSQGVQGQLEVVKEE